MGDTFQKDNKDIVQGFKRNDTVIMKSIYLHTYPKVRSYILKNSGTDALAKDTFQEAFVACWSNIKAERFSESGNVAGYLFTIAKNKWTDYLRSSDFKKKVTSDNFTQLTVVAEESPPEESVDEDRRRSLRKALEQLGSNCKQLLQLFYFEQKSMKEISMLLNVAPASARNQKYRCMEKLRTLSLSITKNG